MHFKNSFLLLLILFSLCTNYLMASNQKQSDNNLEKVTIQLSWFDQFQFAGYYIAKEKGFYKDAGLDVNIKPFEFGIDIPTEVSKGKFDFAVGRETLILEKANNKNIVALYALFQASPLILVSTKESGINEITDFSDKRIMTTIDDASEVSIKAMITSQKLDIKNLNFIKHTHNIKDLIEKKTDVISAYTSKSPYHLQQKNIPYNVFSPTDYGFDMYSDLLYTSELKVKNDLETVMKFKEASLKGWQYAYTNIEESVDLILKKYNAQNLTKEELTFEAKELKKLSYYKTDTLGDISLTKLQRIHDLYNVMGLIKQKFDVNSFILPSYPKYNPVFTNKEKEYLKKKKEITMCIDPNWMPFEKFDEKGNHVGMSADYFKIFQNSISTPFKVIKTKAWSESLEFAKEKKCDILSLAMETKQRKNYMNFTSAYLKIPLVVATRLDIPFINDIEELNNKKIGIPKGYAFAEIIKNNYPDIKLVEVDNIDEGLKKLNRGDIFGYVGTITTISYKLQSTYSTELKITGKLDMNWNLAIGVRDDDPTLLNILEKTVTNITPEQHQQILNKWISIKYDQGTDYSWIWYIIYALVIIVIILLLKQYRLNQSLREISELIDSTMEAIFISQDGICIDANKSAVDLLGYTSKSELIGLPLLQLVAEDSKEKVKKGLLLDNAMPYEGNVLKKNGKPFPALIKGHNLHSNPFRVSSVVDITHLKQLESQTKLASMGEMIGNIAHQWRQPLNNTFLYLQFLKDNFDNKNINTELIDKYFERSFNQINYMSQTIDDFAKFLKSEKKPVQYSIYKTIKRFLKIIEPTVKTNDITVSIDYNSLLDINLNGYPNELIQCLINIFNNSKDAFNQNYIDTDARFLIITQKEQENKVIITLQDNAGGIPENIINKVFEPYFTTKHESQGTGLGLHMTYDLIVNSMDGDIHVENTLFKHNNQEYKGAKFTITLNKIDQP